MISKEPQYYDWQQKFRYVIPNHNTSDDVFRSMISKYSRLPSLQLLLRILKARREGAHKNN